MDNKNKITGLSFLVLSQVVLFVLVYLATIAIGVGLVYLAFHASVWFIPAFFKTAAPTIMSLGRLGFALLIVIIIGIIGLWAFIAALGIYLIKPLFIFPKRNRDYGIKLKRENAPELYDLILETADAVGVKKPKEIYVNHQVNACVFFNTGFWNIFFPVRKNLAVGLGLFQSTNSEEIKGILAHEFGHFAQNSMRVGSVLYIANKIIYDLTYRRDKLDGFMVRWCLKDGIWGFWGKATQTIVIKFRDILDYMYRSHQRNYMKLSRQMEFDADAVACRIVGSDHFISALCKIEDLSKSFEFYNRIFNNFTGQNQLIKNYWEGYEKAIPHMQKIGIKINTFDKEGTLQETESNNSLITIEEIWESHPATQKRIEHAKSLQLKRQGAVETINAVNLLTPSLKYLVSAHLLEQIRTNNPGIKDLSWSDFLDNLEKKIEISVFPPEVDIYFNRDLVFNSEAGFSDKSFSEDNKKLISQLNQALNDKVLLNMLDKGKIPVKKFLYNGFECSVKNVPVAEHEGYIEALKLEVAKIDNSIRNEVLAKSNNEALIHAAYDAIEYAQSITSSLKEVFVPVRTEMIKDLNEAKIADEEDFDILRKWLDSYESALKEVLANLRYREIAPFMTREEYEHMRGFLDASRSFIYGINNNAINHMFAVTDWVIGVHDNLAHAAKMVIINTLLGKEITDSKFLELWIPQEESQPINNVVESKEDGKPHVVLNTDYGVLDLPIPSDEEIDKIYYEEWFRQKLWQTYDQLQPGQILEFKMVATVPFKEENGEVSCENKEDEQKFVVEYNEFLRFMDSNYREPDWSAISDSADQGNAYANGMLAGLYLSQNRLELAYEAAVKSALGGVPDGIAILGVVLSKMDEGNQEISANLFKCAAVGGHIHALYNLGLRYASGNGIEKDESKAFNLFERSAFQGNPMAQHNLGFMYLNGHAVQQDAEKALFWLYKAANNGYNDSVNLIWKYHKAMGNQEHYVQAVKWGAEQGIEECLAELQTI